MKKLQLAIAGAALLLAWPAGAQDPQAIKGAVGAPKADTMGHLGGDLNFGQIDGDLFTTINLDFALDLGKIGFGVRVPLRIRVIDEDPQDNESASVFRKEDWDEFADYLKIIRYFRYGHKGEIVYLMLGDLPGVRLGHGTIVNRYYNNVDMDHYKMGLAIDINTDYGGVETLINHLIDPNLIGGRAYLRPWSLIDPDAYLNNLAVGFSMVTDFQAPYELVPGATEGTYEVEDGYPKVAKDQSATVIGGDIEFQVLNTSLLSITPYMDLNSILGAGTGYHAGFLNVFHVPVISLDLQATIEYRYFTGDYIPTYFNSYYEIQKFAFPYRNETLQQDLVEPKRRVLDQMDGKGLNGYFAEVAFRFMNLFTIGASFDDYDGLYNSNLRAYIDVPALEIVQFGAYYYKHNFEGADKAFTFDDKSLVLVEGKYQINSYLYLVGQYWRIWQLNNDPADEQYGQYQAIDDWSMGVGMSYNF